MHTSFTNDTHFKSLITEQVISKQLISFCKHTNLLRYSFIRRNSAAETVDLY